MTDKRRQPGAGPTPHQLARTGQPWGEGGGGVRQPSTPRGRFSRSPRHLCTLTNSALFAAQNPISSFSCLSFSPLHDPPKQRVFSSRRHSSHPPHPSERKRPRPAVAAPDQPPMCLFGQPGFRFATLAPCGCSAQQPAVFDTLTFVPLAPAAPPPSMTRCSLTLPLPALLRTCR